MYVDVHCHSVGRESIIWLLAAKKWNSKSGAMMFSSVEDIKR